ncbi:hypothetical protein DL93DRAFT_2171110 [Clavulina sp. PMI_390]|nr:hypothetical protein DL93DRAFT_2171110 [Clavulina sp. PMI_390]
MRAVSLVAPKYEFLKENYAEIEQREKFFRKVNNPSILTDLPESVGINASGRKLIFKSVETAYQKYLELVSAFTIGACLPHRLSSPWRSIDQANASLERHRARARLPADRYTVNARADAETSRSDAEAR